MRTWRAPATAAGGVLATLHALPGLLVLSLASGGRRDRRRREIRQWRIVWAAFTLPLLLWTLVTANWLEGGLLVLQGALGLTAGALLWPDRRPLRFGLMLGLWGMALAGVVAALYSPRSLTAYEGSRVVTRLDWSGVQQRVVAPITPATALEREPAARRSWLLSGGEGLSLTGRIRAVDDASSSNPEVLVTLDWPDRAVGAQTRVSAGPGWTSFVLDVPEGVVDPFVIMRLYVPAGTAIDVAGLRLTVSEGGPARAPPATRQALHLGHPVTFAHVAVAVATVLMLLVRGLGGALLVALPTATIAWASGTRAAFVALAVLFIVPLLRRSSRRVAAGAIVAVAVLASGALLVQRERAAALLEAVPRNEVWATAVRAFAEHPIVGLRGNDIEFETFANASSGARLVSHAHNLWLEHAADHGIFGLVASLSLGIGLLTIAARRGGLLGVASLAPLLVLNLVDATLLHGQVLIAVTLTLNLLTTQGKDGTRAASLPPVAS